LVNLVIRGLLTPDRIRDIDTSMALHMAQVLRQKEIPMSYLKDKLFLAEPVTEGAPAGQYTKDLDGLIAWLETQPKDKVYCWADTGHCLFSQWGEALGLGKQQNAYLEVGKLPSWEMLTDACIAVVQPYTFGAALKRAKAFRDRG
jgi:hypothetical protein